MTQDEAKKRILARRARFVAIAMASTGLPAATQACGGNVESNTASVSEDAGAEACLSPPEDAALDQAQPCLGAPLDASDEPQVCLSQAIDAADGPQPCLDPPMDATPEVCLEPPEDAGFEACLSPPEDASDAPQVCLDIDPDASGDV